MKKIVYISGTRADFGLMKNVLNKINDNSELNLNIFVTGMHLMSEFGNTIKEIKRYNFNFLEIDSTYKKDSKESMVKFLSKFLEKALPKISGLRPDIILVIGDRAEMLGGAILGNYLSIPVFHIHGGEKTSTVDDNVRHSITKLSHFHFPATNKSAFRIEKMGEEKWRILKVGAPGLEDILDENFSSSSEIESIFNIDLNKPVLLIIQHPVTLDYKESAFQMKETMEAIKKMGYQSVIIYPNSDAGGREMIRIIEKYRDNDFIKIFKNISREEFLGLMRVVSVMIGNSSSGIIEAPSFNLPVLNIGSRQEGRERAGNVIDIDYNRKLIQKITEKLIKKEKKKKYKNPYKDKKTSSKIVKKLLEVRINKKLLDKKLTY